MSAGVRILYVGPANLVAPLEDLGHEVIDIFGRNPRLAAPGQPFDLRPLWAAFVPKPDVLFVVDVLGVTALPFGIEDIPAVRVYWAIDPHLNFFWQRHYAQLFDLALLTQRDLVPLFTSEGLRVEWLPWGAEPAYLAPFDLPRVHDVVFIGTVDATTRPKRAAAIARLKERFGLVSFGETAATRLAPEEAARVLASSKIAFNECVLGDLNFRVFEAMAAGALLLTETIDNGLTEVFTPGRHLDVYTPETLCTRVEHYLYADAEREQIAARGQAEVRARHTLATRMQTLTGWLDAGVSRRPPRARAALHWGMTAHLTVVRGLTDPRVSWPAALESLRLAVVEHGEAEAAIAVAEILAANGRAESALAALREARRLDPTRVRGWLLAAEIERQRGKTQAAGDLIREGITGVPGLTTAARQAVLAALDTVGPTGSACFAALGCALQELGLPLIPGLTPVPGAALPRTALDYHTLAVNTDPSNRAAAAQAAALLEFSGLAEFAGPFCEMALRADPVDASVRALWQRCRQKSHQPTETL